MPSQFGFHSHPWKSRVAERRPSSSGFTTMHLGTEFCPKYRVRGWHQLSAGRLAPGSFSFNSFLGWDAPNTTGDLAWPRCGCALPAQPRDAAVTAGGEEAPLASAPLRGRGLAGGKGRGL